MYFHFWLLAATRKILRLPEKTALPNAQLRGAAVSYTPARTPMIVGLYGITATVIMYTIC